MANALSDPQFSTEINGSNIQTPQKTRGNRVDVSALTLLSSSEDDESETDAPNERPKSSEKTLAKPASRRQANWTRHDAARLIELIASPEGQQLLSQSGCIMSRQELDSRNSIGSNDPWKAIAELYNDYQNFKPQNSASCDERLAAFHPHPLRGSRPPRNGNFLSSKFASMRSEFTKAWQHHNRSGQHAGDLAEQIEEWFRFCNGNLQLLYMFVAWRDVSLDGIARLLPDGIGQEEGVRVSSTAVTSSRSATPTRNVKRKSSAIVMIDKIQELATPPDIKKQRSEMDAETSRSLALIAETMQADLALRREHLQQKSRNTDISTLTTILQSTNIPEGIRTQAEEQLRALLCCSEQSLAVNVQINYSTINNSNIGK